MHYYTVWVASGRYHSPEPLTYKSEIKLLPGSFIVVPLKQWSCLAIVEKEMPEPSFNAKAIIELLQEVTPLPTPLLTLRDWLQQYYPAPSGVVTQHFAPTMLLSARRDTPSVAYDKPGAHLLPVLNHEQKAAVTDMRAKGSYLLHGETGTGKTRVYQELALQTIQHGQSVIILTPEIGLTAQLYKNFRDVFGNRTLLVHSHLAPAKRQQIWQAINAATEPLVIVGARSALFSPLQHVGLIVVDEAHEPAYKQDQSPRYNAVRVASKLAGLHKATLVLGSATPLVTDYFIAEQKNIPILRLTKPAISKRGVGTESMVVDIKDRTQFTRAAHLSNPLLEAIDRALQRKEQVLLFLNRRGTARIVLCQTCGWQAMCPHCDTPLTYHDDTHVMRCHSCNYRQSAVIACPVCQGTDILFKSIGTKAIVSEVQHAFPQARVQRFDTDNKKAERFEEHYDNVAKGNVDIIVGTQVLAKGLDLPNLSVVGVVTADTSLYIPDFMAQERTYQLVSQVVGRTGRGSQHGQVIIQTYSPDNPTLRAALRKDWSSFYAQEITERQQFMFPPFCYLLKLTCRRRSSQAAQRTGVAFIESLKQQKLRININGPAPSFHEKHGTLYEWQLIIKAKRRSELLKVIELLPSGWSYDIDPTNLL